MRKIKKMGGGRVMALVFLLWDGGSVFNVVQGRVTLCALIFSMLQKLFKASFKILAC